MPLRARTYIGSLVTSAPSSSTRPESGAVSPTHHVERRRLAGAVRTEQPHDLARVHLEADAADDRATAVGLREALVCAASPFMELGSGHVPADVVCVRASSLPSTVMLSVALKNVKRLPVVSRHSLRQLFERRARADRSSRSAPSCAKYVSRAPVPRRRAPRRHGQERDLRRRPRAARVRVRSRRDTARSCPPRRSPSGPTIARVRRIGRAALRVVVDQVRRVAVVSNRRLPSQPCSRLAQRRSYRCPRLRLVSRLPRAARGASSIARCRRGQVAAVFVERDGVAP